MKKLKPLCVKFKGNKKFQRLLDNKSQSKLLKSGSLILRPGEEIGEHITESREEAIIILKGLARIVLPRKQINAQKGSLVYIPPETRHNVLNCGRSLLHYVYLVVPISA
jgi:mannose-6-phosphate isomerase-like protein (cupin superfamily)